MTLGEKLKFYRKKNGLTQEKVAAWLHTDRPYYTYLETGKTPPTAADIWKLSKLFHVSTEVLMDRSVVPAQPVRVAVRRVHRQKTAPQKREKGGTRQ